MKEKPQVVQLYNNNMMGVDRLDQMATYYILLSAEVGEVVEESDVLVT